MTWFTASVLIALKPLNYVSGEIEVYENMLLIEAATAEEANCQARKFGRVEASLDDGLTLNGVPIKREFVGIRKLITVSNPYPSDLDKDCPTNGTELTYALYSVSSIEQLKQLVEGNAVEVLYIE